MPRIRLRNPFKKKAPPPPPPPTRYELVRSHVGAHATAYGGGLAAACAVVGALIARKVFGKGPAPRASVTPSPSPGKRDLAAADLAPAVAVPAAAAVVAAAPAPAPKKPAPAPAATPAYVRAASVKAEAAIAAVPPPPAAAAPAGGGWKVSTYDMQGRRKTMEDAHVYAPKTNLGDVLGILDGCGGGNASTFCAASFERTFAAAPPGNPREALAAAFAQAEAEVLVTSEAKRWLDATTATVALVGDARLDVAWVGDSRAVLATRRGATKKLAAEALVTDHRPDAPAEKARVKALGGGCGRNEKEAKATPKQVLRANVVGAHVVFNVNRKSHWRVFPGGIALTRALGARPLKRATPQLIIAEPELAGRDLDGSEAFLIVACDGVWDTMSDLQACEAVQAALAAGAENPAEALVQKAYLKGSDDNISACVLVFEKGDAANESAV